MTNNNIFKRIDKNKNPSIYLILVPATGRTFMSYIRFARKLPNKIGCIFIGESIYDLASTNEILNEVNKHMTKPNDTNKYIVVGHCGGNSLAQFISSKAWISNQICGTIMIDVYPKGSEKLRAKKDQESAQKIKYNTNMLSESEANEALERYNNAIKLTALLEEVVNNTQTFIISNIKDYVFDEMREKNPNLKEITYINEELDEFTDGVLKEIVVLAEKLYV